MLLAGEIENLPRALEHFRLCEVARIIDLQVSSLSSNLRHAVNDTETLRRTVDRAHETDCALDQLSAWSQEVDKVSKSHGPSISATCASLRDLLSQLDAGTTSLDHGSGCSLVSARKRAVLEAQEQVETWKESVEVLSERLSDLRQLTQTKIAEERAKKEAEGLRLKAEAEARARAERRVAEQAEARAQAANEERQRLENAAREQERLVLEAADAQRREVRGRQVISLDEDVFGMDGLPNAGSIMTRELSDLHSLIASLRKRLRAINIGEVVQPNLRGTSSLPTEDKVAKLERSFTALLDEANILPDFVTESAAVDADLRCLRSEIQIASNQLRRAHQLASLATSVQHCDNALSDLLEHIDSFPALPTGSLASSHDSNPRLAPEDQMSARLSFTQTLVDGTISRSADLSDDSRAAAETARISQTWDELCAMALDRIAEEKSRPPSVVSNGRVSRSATTPNPVPGPPKRPSAPRHSASSSTSTPKFLAPPPPKARRSVSGASIGSSHSRSSSRASNASTPRSVSGPISIPVVNPTSRLYTSTFASRQRSTSVTSNGSNVTEKQRSTPTLPSNPLASAMRTRSGTNQHMPGRTASPAPSEMSRSRSSLNMSRSSVGSTSKSSWSRAPRQSFPHVPKSPSGPKPAIKDKKPYIPNPKNKLDVAVGDVVNKLPVSINVEVVADTWKDQSGKYWIGDEDPKLCFCRILRSQTVMVRVGGGWSELSKFIKEHFADAFRLVPDSPRRPVPSAEEKWISSATLQQQSIQEILRTPPSHPRTPEPSGSFTPSFALSSSSGASPKSMKSSSPGSPLQPIQFIRRLDRDSPLLRTDTPTNPLRPSSVAHTPKAPVWRP